jgi:hypothetical protein
VRRRSNPELVYQGQWAGIFRRLVGGERVNELVAEHLIARWEREAPLVGSERDSPGYWDEAWRWIEDQREPGRSGT